MSAESIPRHHLLNQRTLMAATLKLIRKQRETGNVWSFIFEPSRPLPWAAGQFIRVGLPHANPDGEGTKRYFTIASAPYEKHIQISTRITASSFKQALAGLAPGQTLGLIDPPAGDFVWPPSGRPLVFVAQGIGITPFYSMLRQQLHDRLPPAATLLYANLTPEIPFQSELAHWAGLPGLTIKHHRQPFTAADVARLAPDYHASHVYVSGPGPLIELLLPPYDLPINQLKQDTFPNYDAWNY